MNLPTEQQCLGLFAEYKVPKHILEHCLKVREVAIFLAKRLKGKGVEICPELVDRGALLHDLLKVVALEKLSETYLDYTHSEEEVNMWKRLRDRYPGMKEGKATYLFLKDDYPELALLIRDFGDHRKTTRNWEEIVLLYADAVVLRNNIVSLNERKNYIQKRYGFPFTDSFFQIIGSYEEKIMNKTGLEPKRLAEEINNG